jgi:hypothetical protein
MQHCVRAQTCDVRQYSKQVHTRRAYENSDIYISPCGTPFHHQDTVRRKAFASARMCADKPVPRFLGSRKTRAARAFRKKSSIDADRPPRNGEAGIEARSMNGLLPWLQQIETEDQSTGRVGIVHSLRFDAQHKPCGSAWSGFPGRQEQTVRRGFIGLLACLCPIDSNQVRQVYCAATG